MKWKTQPLASLARIGAGQGAPQRADEFGSEGRPFVRAGSLERLCGGADEDSLEKIPDSVAQRRQMTLYPAGTIVFAKSGMSATLGRVYTLTKPCFVVSHLATINAETGVDTKFLAQFFRFSPPSRLIKDAAYPSIRLVDISELEIPLPPLEEQRRIAAVLVKADDLCRQRQKTLRLTEDLLQSTFIKTFGNETAPHCPRVSLSGYLDFITSGGRGWAKYYSKEGHKFIRSLDVQMNEIDDSQIVRVTPPRNAEADRTRTRTGDVLLTITGSLIGRVAPVTEAHAGAFVSQHVAILRTHGFQPEFLSWAISTQEGQRQIQKNQRGQMKPGLNFEQIGRLKIPRPSNELEETFTKLIKKRQSILAQQRDALEYTNSFFASLQQFAFRGELDLSRLVLESPSDAPPASEAEKAPTKVTKPQTGRLFIQAPQATEAALKKLDDIVTKGGPIPWSPEYFKYRILGTQSTPFSFSEVMQTVESIFDEAPYEEIKDMIFGLLGQDGGTAILSQSFDLHIDDETKDVSGRKEIVFGPAS
jgi:type I restriction enzyme S subunit